MDWLTDGVQVWHLLVLLGIVVGLWLYDEWRFRDKDDDVPAHTHEEFDPPYWGDKLVKFSDLTNLEDRVEALERRTWQHKLMRWLKRQ